MGLLAAVRARLGVTWLRWRELLEARRHDGVKLLMLATMGHYLIGVRAHEFTFEAVKVRRFVLHRAEVGRVDAVGPGARHVGAELLEVAAHQGVEPLVAGRVLHEAGLVAERVPAVLSHAVEMGLMLPVPTVRVFTVFVESEAHTDLH